MTVPAQQRDLKPAVLTANGLGKHFRRHEVLRSISFRLGRGEILGVAGANGAGKTTLINIVCGLAVPSTGEVVLGGTLALLPERIGFIEHLSGLANLRLLSNLRAHRSRQELENLLSQVGLEPRRRAPVSRYSLGMRQRLGVAQVLIEGADVVVLDEPTNGLDAAGIRWMRHVLRCEAARGAGVLVTSHLLTELEVICDRVLIISEGRITNEWRPGKQTTAGAIRVLTPSPDMLREAGSRLGWQVEPTAEGWWIVVGDVDPVRMIAALFGEQVPLGGAWPLQSTIEDLMMPGSEAERL